MPKTGSEAGSAGQPEDRCPTCGTALNPGEGVETEWSGRMIRFRCLGCLARFEADPVRYLAGNTEPCRLDERPAARLDLARARIASGYEGPATSGVRSVDGLVPWDPRTPTSG